MAANERATGLYLRNSTWWLCVTVGGRKVRRSLQTDDRAEAERRGVAERKRLIAQRWGEDRHSWPEAAGRWLQEVAPGQLGKATVERYLFSLRVVDPVLGSMWLDEIDRRALSRIAMRPGVTNATKRRDLTAVSAVLRAAVSWGWIDANPALTFDRSIIRYRSRPITLPEDHEVEHLIAGLPAMLGRLVRLLELTGMRLEEATSLTWRQIDLRRSSIQLERTKAGRPRAVPLTAEALRVLQSTPRHMATAFVFWHGQERPDRYHRLNSYLFALRRRAGIKWRIHDLRHLFAVRYLRAGGRIYDLQKILGHGSIAVTEHYCDHLTPDEAELARAGVVR